jgi:acetyl-CoA acyltransferase
MRQAFLSAQKLSKKGTFAMLNAFKGIQFKDLAPEAPAIANYTTGEVMGHSSDRLAAKFGISRQDQDEFTVRSHHLAAQAHANGLYRDEIIPVNGSVTENGIKSDTNYDKVSKLSPAFIKPHGTHTAANSSFLTDGASATLLMSEAKALRLGYQPKAILRGWTYVASDPFEELLLGPTYAIHKILRAHGLTLADIGVLEIHEAFAGQVLSNLKAMASVKFAEKNFFDKLPVGEIDMDRMNLLGGSLSLGHPFGATGGRLVTTTANRLIREGKKYGILAACADGGLAHAALIERYE